MSQENLEVVRRVSEVFVAAVERGDPDAVFDMDALADDVEWLTPFFPGSEEWRVWRGREEFVGWFREWTEDFEGWSMRIARVVDAGGDRVVALTHQSATGTASGVPVELDSGVVWELKDGRMIRGTLYGSQAEALEAAGLSE
jgi:ketosteroid isomerase-like protein